MSQVKDIIGIQELIASEIASYKFGDHPSNLYEPIDYIMSLGGKRLRPALVMLGYQLSGNEPRQIVQQALAVEVFHNFTLMHDDIMDNAPLRRGMQTVHEKWNDTVAILSGDTMLVKAYELLSGVSSDILPRALKRFNQTAVEVCEGQQIDMDFESRSDATEEEYLEMIRLKTAVLLGYSLELGGMLAGMSEQQCHVLYSIGEQMGIGFQLMDDYLDVYADKEKFGKQVGGDIISNKKTYLLINALSEANSSQAEQLSKWLAASTFDADMKVKAVTAIYDEIGIPEKVKSKMNSYFDVALDKLSSVDGDENAKRIVEQFAIQLMKREK
jgi:geranylgeranyl diphosphate synthase type II